MVARNLPQLAPTTMEGMPSTERTLTDIEGLLDAGYPPAVWQQIIPDLEDAVETFAFKWGRLTFEEWERAHGLLMRAYPLRDGKT